MSLACNSGGTGAVFWSAILNLKVSGRKVEGLTSEITQGEGSARAKRLPENSFHKTLWLNAYKKKKMKGKVLYKEPSTSSAPAKRQACIEYHAHLRKGTSISLP